MTKITGKINSSIQGFIVVTPDHPFVDESNIPNILVMSPIEAPINNGQFTIEVPQSEEVKISQSGQDIKGKGITYKWEIFKKEIITSYYFLNGSPYDGPSHIHYSDGKYYTGSVHSSESKKIDKLERTERRLMSMIHAVCPKTDTDFGLLVGVNQQEPYLDISLMRLADMITKPPYADRIRSKLEFKGDYLSTQEYSLGDVVYSNGSSYVYKSSTSGNKPLTDTTSWQILAAKGAAGSGTKANIEGYNSTSWKGSDSPAAQDDVVAAIAPLEASVKTLTTTVTNAAPINNPVFTGSVTRSQLSFSPEDQELITAKYLSDKLKPPVIQLLPKPLLHVTNVNTFGMSSTAQTIHWDKSIINDNIMSSGIATLPENGDYLIICSLMFSVVGGVTSAFKTQEIKAFFEIPAGSKFFLFNTRDSSIEGTTRVLRQGFQIKTFDKGDQIKIQAQVGGTGVTGGNISPDNGNGDRNNFLIIWKIR